MGQSRFERNWWKAAVGLAVLAFLYWNPKTRAFLVWLLPLGSGIDDLIVIVALVLILVLGFVRGWLALPSWFHRHR